MALITDKGSQILDGLLLRQYHESPNLVQYLQSYVKEMDDLFTCIDDVYFGRLLENAVGAQLDIIGDILQQSRNVDLGTAYFGFIGVTFVEGFGDLNNASLGGPFKSLDQAGASITPLDDATFRRILRCKANLLNSDTDSIEEIYHAVSTVLGRVPTQAIVTEPASLQVDLSLESVDTRQDEYFLLLYMSKYYIPAGVTFTITLI